MVNNNAEVTKAKKQLKDYMEGKRKTKPNKAAMDVLEQAGVISKLDEMSGGVNRLKKAYRWEGFARDTGRDAFDLGAYGYRKAKDAANPVASTVRG